MGSKVLNNCIVIKQLKHMKYMTCYNIELQIKAVLNRCVLSEHLKLLIDLEYLISLGSLFQSLGAAVKIVLSPYDTSLVLGCTNNRLS